MADNFNNPLFADGMNSPPAPAGAVNPSLYGDDFSKVIRELVDDADVSEEIKTRLDKNILFSGLMKTIKLTFFDATDAEVMRHRFEEMVCSFIESISPEEYTTEVDLLIQNLRILWYANVKRSVGTPSNVMNERVALLTQIRHNTNLITDKSGGGGIRAVAARVFRGGR